MRLAPFGDQQDSFLLVKLFTISVRWTDHLLHFTDHMWLAYYVCSCRDPSSILSRCTNSITPTGAIAVEVYKTCWTIFSLLLQSTADNDTEHSWTVNGNGG
jgi:hypothetical protein